MNDGKSKEVWNEIIKNLRKKLYIFFLCGCNIISEMLQKNHRSINKNLKSLSDNKMYTLWIQIYGSCINTVKWIQKRIILAISKREAKRSQIIIKW